MLSPSAPSQMPIHRPSVTVPCQVPSPCDTSTNQTPLSASLAQPLLPLSSSPSSGPRSAADGAGYADEVETKTSEVESAEQRANERKTVGCCAAEEAPASDAVRLDASDSRRPLALDGAGRPYTARCGKALTTAVVFCAWTADGAPNKASRRAR